MDYSGYQELADDLQKVTPKSYPKKFVAGDVKMDLVNLLQANLAAEKEHIRDMQTHNRRLVAMVVAMAIVLLVTIGGGWMVIKSMKQNYTAQKQAISQMVDQGWRLKLVKVPAKVVAQEPARELKTE